MRTWLQLSATRGPIEAGFVGSLVDGGLWRYDVERARTLRGRAPGPIEAGWRVIRAESRATMRRPPCEVCLEGVTSSLAYTTAEEQRALPAKPTAEQTREHTLALLVLVKKSEAWWRLAADERRALFAGTGGARGHLTPAPAGVPLHRVFHARAFPDSEWDFLVLFELDDARVPAAEDLLAGFRESSAAEWRFVEREAELWLRRRAR